MTPLDVMKIIVKIMMQKSKYVFLHVHPVPICSKSAVLIRLADFKLFFYIPSYYVYISNILDL